MRPVPNEDRYRFALELNVIGCRSIIVSAMQTSLSPQPMLATRLQLKIDGEAPDALEVEACAKTARNPAVMIVKRIEHLNG